MAGSQLISVDWLPSVRELREDRGPYSQGAHATEGEDNDQTELSCPPGILQTPKWGKRLAGSTQGARYGFIEKNTLVLSFETHVGASQVNQRCKGSPGTIQETTGGPMKAKEEVVRDGGQGVRPAGRPLSGRKSLGFLLEAAMSPEMYFFPC